MRDIAIIVAVAAAVVAVGYAWNKSRSPKAARRLPGTSSADAILNGDDLLARWDPYGLRDGMEGNTW